MTTETKRKRCEVCDMPEAEDRDHTDAGCRSCARGDDACGHAGLCWAPFGGRCNAVDWRARALAAETERDEWRDIAGRRFDEPTMDAVIATAEGVAAERDEAAATSREWAMKAGAATAERDEARRLLAAAARGELPRCDGCGVRLATAEASPAVGLCDEHRAAATEGLPWAERIAARKRVDEARAAVAGMEGGR